MKSRKTSSIILHHHLDLGDNIICHGIIREYCKIFRKVAIFSYPHNYLSVSFMYRDIKNLTIIKGDYAFAKKFIFLNKFKFGKYKYNEIKLIGFQYLKNKSNLTFEQQFYQIANVNFTKKWSNFYIKRDFEKENSFFKKVAPKKDFAFVHEDIKRNFLINKDRINKKYAIFTPNIKLTKNIFDYCTIIKKAKEIHVIDSSFMFLIDCLKYKNPYQKLFIHRYARPNNEWSLPILKKNWNIITFFDTYATFNITTPTYNNGKYLSETIESVLSQEGDFYINYKIIDRGSIDNTLEIIKKYNNLININLYPIKCKGVKFQWKIKREISQPAAINTGLKTNTGEIFAWINAGDFYEPNAFKTVLEQFIKKPSVDLLYGDGYHYNKNKKKLIHSKKISFSALLKNNNAVFQPSAFLTKNISGVTHFLDENFHYLANLDLWIKIAKKECFSYLPIALSNLRIRENSKTILSQNNLLQEQKKIVRRHENIEFNSKFISFIKAVIPFRAYIRTHTPWLYFFCKNTLYKIIIFFTKNTFLKK